MGFEEILSAYGDEPLETALEALALGLATIEELQNAAATRRRKRPPVAQLAITERALSVAQVFRVVGEQGVSGNSFGEIAVRLGYIDQPGVDSLMKLQASLTPSLAQVLVESSCLSPEQGVALQENVQGRLQNRAELATAGRAN